jgi:hypothetical protein
MRPLERVQRTRRALAATVMVRAGLGATGAALLTAAVFTVVSRRTAGTGAVGVWMLAAIAGVVAFVVLARPWPRLTIPRVALWIEERMPTLRYALVTAIDPVASGPASALLEDQIQRVSWDRETGRAMARSLRWPVATVASGVVALVLAGRVASVSAEDHASAAASATTTGARAVLAPFARLSATIRPPAYSGGKELRVESPASIAALVGSAITLDAPGSSEGIVADIGGRDVAVKRTGDAWQVALTVGDKPALVRLRHSSGERIVAIEPEPDSAPVVRLLQPLRDTVMRVARGALPLSAEAHDDFGLASTAFEYIVSSGEGESFKFRSGTLGGRTAVGARDASWSASLDIESLALHPGDMVHLRAVARDANNVSGPGLGASETRVLRIARSGEYDSIAVEGAPPPDADKSLVSQRMLIILTEALDKKRASLARANFLEESRNIARDETRLRRRVGDIIFQRLGDKPSGEEGADDQPGGDTASARLETSARDSLRRLTRRTAKSPAEIAAADSADSARAALLRAASDATGKGGEILDFEGDETPVVAINRPLLEAYNAMWEASRELEQGETAKALPPMRRALDAIQRARQAERIYLRGKAPSVVVDLARVRLTGKDSGATNIRAPRTAIDPNAVRRAERLAFAIALATKQPAAAIDSITLLRVESLDAAPSLATALAAALDAMRNGNDATQLLARARRVADGSVRGTGQVGPWSGVW